MKRTTTTGKNAPLSKARSSIRKPRMPPFVGAGASGGKLRLSERAEELPFEEGRKGR